MYCNNCGTLIPEGEHFCSCCDAGIHSSQAKICKNCGSVLANGTFYCNICGKPAEKRTVTCTECNTEISEDIAFCPKCNSNIRRQSNYMRTHNFARSEGKRKGFLKKLNRPFKAFMLKLGGVYAGPEIVSIAWKQGVASVLLVLMVVFGYIHD